MKALSISPNYAAAIFCGDKSIECRTWATDYRGDLLICSTAKKIKDTIPSHALCVAELKDIVPFKKCHLKKALMMPADYNPDCYAWILDNIRIIRPFAVKGRLSLWECDHPIEYLDDDCPIDYWSSLFV